MLSQLPGKQEILHTQRTLDNYIHRTSVLSSDSINQMLGMEIYFKCENFQKSGSFKYRGASNAILSLLKDFPETKTVATHSSGNHAGALSRAAAKNKINAEVVMPENSSKVKIKSVQAYGGKITFCKPTLKDREETLKAVIRRTNAIEIHPYNNYDIIAGQATSAKELIEEIPGLDYILAPVGGGGLISGTLLASHYFSKNTKVVAAEPLLADDAYKSFVSKKFVPSVNPQTIADGLLTSLGSLTFPILLEYAHSVGRVSEDYIIEGMRLIWERLKIIVEPSSAVPFSYLLGLSEKERSQFHSKKVGIILSGGNVDFFNLPWNINHGKNER